MCHLHSYSGSQKKLRRTGKKMRLPLPVVFRAAFRPAIAAMSQSVGKRLLPVFGVVLAFSALAWCDCSGSVQYTIGNTQKPTLACQITATGSAFVYTSSITYTNPTNPLSQWLSVSPTSGTIAAGASGVINYNIDPTSLPTGDYYATVALHAPGFADSSDQVHLTVVGGTSTTSISINLPSVQGITIIIDGATYTSNQTFLWIVGSVHTISVPSITGPGGTQTTFNISTSNGSATGNPLQVTVPAGGMTIAVSQVTTPAPSTYTISTFAGGGLPVNIPGTSASLYPFGVAADKAGNIFFVEQNTILRVDAITSIVTLVAGNGTQGFSGDNGLATSAQLTFPSGVAVDSVGNVYISDFGTGRIRKVSNGVITTVAGGGGGGSSGSSLGDNGPATSALLNGPVGVAVDSAGNLYIATADARIRKVTSGIITTLAGNGTPGFTGDNGPATSAQLNSPNGVAVDSAGNVYISDFGNNRIRKVTNGIITTVAGNGTPGYSGDNGPATSAQLNSPNGVAVDSAANVYTSDSGNSRIRKVAGGVITTVAGNGTAGFSGDNGPATGAELNEPVGVASDTSGNLYISDKNRYSDYGLVRKVSNGIITTVAGNGTCCFSGDNGPATSAQIAVPYDVTVDSAGNLYIADGNNNRIRKVSNNGIITTVAGNGTPGFSGDNGPATSAELNGPDGVAVDSAGNLYIADEGNYRIRKVSNGVITTVAGNGTRGFSGDNGPATSVVSNK